jgi:hypothetical protein
MTMPARTVGNKTFLAGGSGLCSLFFDGTHYEKSAKGDNDHAACEDVKKQRIEHHSDQRWPLSRRLLIGTPLTASLNLEGVPSHSIVRWYIQRLGRSYQQPTRTRRISGNA